MLKKLFKRKKSETVSIVSPVRGEYLKLDDVADPVFSGRMIGDGAAVKPECEYTTVVSPVKGKVVVLADSYHAIGIQAENGMELLIHIGLDTVELNGEGFKPLVSLNEQVEVGQPLIEVDVPALEAQGKDPSIPVVVTNNQDDRFAIISCPNEKVEAGKSVIFSVEEL